MSFSDTPQMRFPLNMYTDQQSILNAMSMRPEFGRTATSLALDFVGTDMFTAANGDRDIVPNYAIMLTDGYSNIDRDKTIPSADALRALGIIVISVGIGHEGCLDPPEIKAIGNSPDYQYTIIVPDYATIEKGYLFVLDFLCQAV